MILVTGATGFIGRSVMNWLERAGKKAKAHHGRINNPLDLRQQLEGVDTVIHLAGAEARGRDRLLHHVDIDGTSRLIEECQRAGVKRILAPSRIGSDHNSLHPLLQAKGEIERQVRQSGIPYTILRTATLFGRGDLFTEIIVSLALWTWPFVWLPGSGAVLMQPLWVEDFARCVVDALDRPDLVNKTITLGGEEQLRYREIVRQLLTAAGKWRIMLPIPLIILHPVSSLLFSWWWRPPVTRYFVDRFFVPEVTDFDAVLRHFGFRPARLSESIAYLRQSGLRGRIFRWRT
ncbi:MAG: NAD(P)H-binding protein [Ardenticatenaceae bacterium]|nr:NAD(P)H-binding protein [Ardenticatenaceae bacterium]